MRIKLHDKGEIEVSLEEIKAIGTYLKLDINFGILVRELVDEVIQTIELHKDDIKGKIKRGF
jgi:hypothetical protein